MHEFFCWFVRLAQMEEIPHDDFDRAFLGDLAAESITQELGLVSL